MSVGASFSGEIRNLQQLVRRTPVQAHSKDTVPLRVQCGHFEQDKRQKTKYYTIGNHFRMLCLFSLWTRQLVAGPLELLEFLRVPYHTSDGR